MNQSFILIPGESKNIETTFYSARHILDRFNQAYDSKDGKKLIYWLNIYEKYYGTNDIIS